MVRGLLNGVHAYLMVYSLLNGVHAYLMVWGLLSGVGLLNGVRLT